MFYQMTKPILLQTAWLRIAGHAWSTNLKIMQIATRSAMQLPLAQLSMMRTTAVDVGKAEPAPTNRLDRTAVKKPSTSEASKTAASLTPRKVVRQKTPSAAKTASGKPVKRAAARKTVATTPAPANPTTIRAKSVKSSARSVSKNVARTTSPAKAGATSAKDDRTLPQKSKVAKSTLDNAPQQIPAASAPAPAKRKREPSKPPAMPTAPSKPTSD